MKTSLIAACVVLAGCAPQPEPGPAPATAGVNGLLPGSIGLLTTPGPTGVIVAEVRREGAAAAAGLRSGDLVLRYNGVPVSSVREFNRLTLDSRPGSVVRLEVQRAGEVRQVELPVRELDTMPRV